MLCVWILFYGLLAFFHTRFDLILNTFFGVVELADTFAYTARQFGDLLATKQHYYYYGDS